jgi:glucose-1-phosphate thymidylyltransferase
MDTREIVGLVPAGGQATRIAPLPCSKELYPIGFHSPEAGGLQTKVVSHYLLEKMRLAGITKAYVVLRPGKWDIPAYFGDGSNLNMHLAYLMMRSPLGVPYTLDQAYPFVEDVMVAFGFPDILFQPDDAFIQLLSRRQQTTDADVLLGMFPTDIPEKEDLVDVDEKGRVRGIVIKPQGTRLFYTWGVAVWTPVFSKFLHEYVSARPDPSPGSRELTAGDVLQAAIENHLRVDAVPVSKDPYLDIGTPERLFKAVKDFAVRQGD